MKPSFSIVIPLYNKRPFIERTMKAVLNQTHTNCEIIVVNDGSTDRGEEFVRRFQDDRIRILSQSNAGVSAARNKGIRASGNDFIAFLDADDYWDPLYLEQMARLIRDFPGAGMYGCAFRRVDKERTPADEFHLEEDFRGFVPDYFKHAGKHLLYWTSATVIDRKLSGHTGFFDERIKKGEDLDLWFRIALSHKVVFNNRVLAFYSHSDKNRVTSRKVNFQESILCHTSKYKPFEQDNPAFRKFINDFRIAKIPEVFLRAGAGKTEKRRFLKEIDTSDQNLKRRLFMKFPYELKKLLIYAWFRGLTEPEKSPAR